MPPGSSPRRGALMADSTRSRARPTWAAPARPSGRSSPSVSTTRRSTRSSSRTAPARSCSEAPSTTARAHPSPMRVIEICRRRLRRHGAALPRRFPPRRPQLHRLRSRATTDDGHYEFWTRNPGLGRRRGAVLRRDRLRSRTARQAAHAHLPPERRERLAADPLLSSLTADERATLIATRTPDGGLHYDIRLQGEKETVFLVY